MPNSEPTNRACSNCADRATCGLWLDCGDDPQYSTDMFCTHWKSGVQNTRNPPTDEDGERVGVWE